MNVDTPAANVVVPGLSSKRPVRNDTDRHHAHGLAIINFFPKSARRYLVDFLGEFVGTFMFLFFAFSATQVANYTAPGASVADAPNTSNLLFVALAFGFSLAVNAWVFFRITGGLFNPAVTLGMCLIGALSWTRGLVIFLAQIVGGIAGAAVVSGLLPGEMSVGTALGGGCSVVQGLFIEMFLTAELVFAIFMMAAEKHRATFIAPIGIGLSLFIAELPGVYYTGGSLNPTRSFAPAVINGKFPGYHWIYWVGPFLGSLLAVAFFKIVKGLEYETVSEDASEPARPAEQGDKSDTAAADAAVNGRRGGVERGESSV